jgi:LmbE family N-acetylglucosaminyl deacetylase
MDIAVFVAHPDDCVIYAYPLIEAMPQHTWHIVYMTYTPESPRGREISAFWQARNVRTSFLGWPDTPGEYEANKTLLNPQLVADSFHADCEYILTHNMLGEYGHVHHRVVHHAAELLSQPKIYFANNMKWPHVAIECKNMYNTQDLPLHGRVVEMFTDRNIGKYILPEGVTYDQIYNA